jgi:hypothetical protein
MKNDIDTAKSAVGKSREIRPMPLIPDQGVPPGSYDYRLVALSVATAMLAAYAALDLGGRFTASPGARSRTSPQTATHLDDKSP